jgi:hypothetical protein
MLLVVSGSRSQGDSNATISIWQGSGTRAGLGIGTRSLVPDLEKGRSAGYSSYSTFLSPLTSKIRPIKLSSTLLMAAELFWMRDSCYSCS